MLPCHVRNSARRSARGIIRELKNVRYIKQIVVGIDGANAVAWKRAKRIFGQLPQKPILLWNDGPRMKRLMEELIESTSTSVQPARRNLWLCFRYVLASEKSRMVAAQTGTSLSPAAPGTACPPDFAFRWPIPILASTSQRLQRAIHRPAQRPRDALAFHSSSARSRAFSGASFSSTTDYALSGEVSLDHDIIRRARVPSTGASRSACLQRRFRVSSPKSICQVDVAECYDHKHQELSTRDTARSQQDGRRHRQMRIPHAGLAMG